MEANTLHSKHVGHGECHACGEEFKPELAIGESCHWTCLRCETMIFVLRLSSDTFGVAALEERGGQ